MSQKTMTKRGPPIVSAGPSSAYTARVAWPPSGRRPSKRLKKRKLKLVKKG